MPVNNVKGGINVFQSNEKAKTTNNPETKKNQQSIFTMKKIARGAVAGGIAGAVKGLFNMSGIIDKHAGAVEYHGTTTDGVGYSGTVEYGGSVEYNGEVDYSGNTDYNDGVGYSGTVTVNHTFPIYENGKLIDEQEITQDLNINGNKTE